MEKISSFTLEGEGVEIDVDECIAILKITRNAFVSLAKLEVGESLLETIDKIESDKGLKAILIINTPGTYSEEAYTDFLSAIAGDNMPNINLGEISASDLKTIVARKINVLDRIIMKKLETTKIIISALQGVVVTPFFGASLSSDFRFASDGMSFSLAHIKYGFPPTGGIAFFLPRYLGQARAVELLVKGGDIGAAEGVEMGLINKVFAKEKFEEDCIREAKEICKIDPQAINLTQSCIYYFQDEFMKCIDRERKLIETF